MFRHFISSLLSFTLMALFLTATVGIDVHINHHDGEVFVVSLLGRTDCESLHPEDVCHCLEHHCGHCNANDEDCEDYISVISLAGDGFDLVMDFSPTAFFVCSIGSPVAGENYTDIALNVRYRDTSPRQYLNSLCVLRV